MGRWIERRKKHAGRAGIFAALTQWPYSPWYFTWLLLFFGSFFLRWATIWSAALSYNASPSYSTLPQNLAFLRTYKNLSKLSPDQLATGAASVGDFRTIGWQSLRGRAPLTEKQCELMLFNGCLRVAQTYDLKSDDPLRFETDCNTRRLRPGYAGEGSKTGRHFLTTVKDLCALLPQFDKAACALEGCGYEKDLKRPAPTKEALALYVRFTAFFFLYNNALMNQPQTQITHELEWKDYLELDAPWHVGQATWVYRVPEQNIQTWTTWDVGLSAYFPMN